MMDEECITYYSELAEKLKINSERENLSIVDVEKMVTLLNVIIEDTNSNDERSMMLVYNIFRCLRNSCVHCTKNQNMIIKSNVFGVLERLMDKILTPENDKDPMLKGLAAKVKTAFVQFLGNLVVQNPVSQKVVWKAGFPKLFFTLMSTLGLKEKDYLCMVAYNCLKNREVLYASTDEYWFLVTVIEYCKDHQEAVWGLLIMELIITSTFFIDFFKELNDYSGLRSSIIEFMIAHLANEDDATAYVDIPEENLLHFCEVFATKSTCILMLATSISSELEDEVCLLLKILSLMCTVTSMVQKYEQVRSNEKLLKSSIELLKQKQSANKEKKNKENLPSQHPEIGFERDLVRLIANMIYKNRSMQDKVREVKGIEVLLNACNIDTSNPYIMQWAVFAIKNLCENNASNQEYIGELSEQGLTSNEILAQNNLEAHMVNGKIKITNQIL